MENANDQSQTTKSLLIAASFIIIVAGVHYASHVLIPFLLAAFISIVCAPPLRFLQNKGIPVSLSILIVLSMLLLAGSLLVIFVGASLNDFSQELPTYQNQLRQQLSSFSEILNQNGIHIPKENLSESLNPAVAMTMAANALSKLGNALTNTFLILITVIFILLEASSFKHKIHLAFGNNTQSLANFETFVQSVNHYLAIKSIFSLITGLLIALWLKVLGVNHPLLWGLIAFLLNYVPNIGSIIAAVPAVLLAFIQLGPTGAGLAALAYIAVNVILGSMVEPRFMGQGLGLSTLVVFISLVLWGSILGIVGMLLSIPLTMIVKIALENNDDTRWIAILLSSGASAKKELAQK